MNRITITTINESVKNASYAVRGRIVARAQDLQKAGKTIISCNIGNPHALGQKGISFVRNVLALVLAPHAKIEGPKDIYLRANRYLSSISDIGAYTDSQGILAVRQDVCKFLHERDGFEASPENIFLTNGASEAVRLCMQTIIRSSSSGFKDGVLTPIPQYPLYSALSTLLDAQLVPYYLDESKDWNCSCESLSEA
jgi:aspartate/methionine/tyrosine aminotransferase